MNNASKNALTRWLSSKVVRLGLSLVISGVSLYLAVRRVTWSEVWGTLIQADWIWVCLAVCSVGVNNFSKIVRWKLLAEPAETRTSFKYLSLTFLAGQLMNLIYPGRIGDLSRAYMTGSGIGQKAFMLGTIVLEKALDVVAYAMLAVLMILWIPMPSWIHGSVAGLVLGGLAVLIMIQVVTRLHNIKDRLPPRFSTWLQQQWLRLVNNKFGYKLVGWLRTGSESVKVLGNRQLLWGIICLTFIVWGTALLNNYLVIRALSLDLDWPGEALQASLVILVGLIAGITVPSIPGRFGVFEYICILSLQLFLMPQSIALSYGILLHAVVFVPQVILGLVAILLLGLLSKGGGGEANG